MTLDLTISQQVRTVRIDSWDEEAVMALYHQRMAGILSDFSAKVLERAQQIIKTDTRKRAPTGAPALYWQGGLHDSLRIEIDTSARHELGAYIIADIEYAHKYELGWPARTGPKPNATELLAWTLDRMPHLTQQTRETQLFVAGAIAESVWEQGTPEYRFMERALNELRGELKQMMKMGGRRA